MAAEDARQRPDWMGMLPAGVVLQGSDLVQIWPVQRAREMPLTNPGQ